MVGFAYNDGLGDSASTAALDLLLAPGFAACVRPVERLAPVVVGVGLGHDETFQLSVRDK